MSLPAPATKKHEGLADAGAANPFRPGKHTAFSDPPASPESDE